MASYDIIVIGCGISGAATAYHLKSKGAARVLVLESGAGPATGPTGKSAGVVRMHYSHPILVRMAMESRDMFADMKDMLGSDGGFRRKGWWLAVGANVIDHLSDLAASARPAQPSPEGESRAGLVPRSVIETPSGSVSTRPAGPMRRPEADQQNDPEGAGCVA